MKPQAGTLPLLVDSHSFPGRVSAETQRPRASSRHQERAGLRSRERVYILLCKAAPHVGRSDPGRLRLVCDEQQHPGRHEAQGARRHHATASILLLATGSRPMWRGESGTCE